MIIAKEFRRIRNRAMFRVFLFFLLVPTSLFYLFGEMGFLAGMMMMFVVGPLLAIPAFGLMCPHCTHWMYEKRGAGGMKWYSPTIPNECPQCQRELDIPLTK